VGAARQRRTIRLMQALLVLLAAGLLMYAGYSLGRAHGFAEGRHADGIDPPRAPSVIQPVVLAALGVAALGSALALQGGGGVRVPTPARLDELSGRTEAAAIRRAEGIGDRSQ
jgi:TRAP-type C4-dicarboxylate transport system permease small subunit